jgi:hypothetical protein
MPATIGAIPTTRISQLSQAREIIAALNMMPIDHITGSKGDAAKTFARGLT